MEYIRYRREREERQRRLDAWIREEQEARLARGGGIASLVASTVQVRTSSGCVKAADVSMRPRGRRSPRNLPSALNQGSVVTAPADGDCFFWIVAKAKDVTVAELRSLVADNYDEATFRSVCVADQAPFGCNDYETFINGLRNKGKFPCFASYVAIQI